MIKTINKKLILLYIFFVLVAVIDYAISECKGKWITKAPMPTPRTEVTASLLDGQIYVIGGFEKSGESSLVETYNIKDGRWNKVSSLPIRLHHAGSAVANGKLYVVGGYTYDWKPVNGVYEYNEDKWVSRAEMPTKRGALALGVISNKIFAVGGVGENKKIQV